MAQREKDYQMPPAQPNNDIYVYATAPIMLCTLTSYLSDMHLPQFEFL